MTRGRGPFSRVVMSGSGCSLGRAEACRASWVRRGSRGNDTRVRIPAGVC